MNVKQLLMSAEQYCERREAYRYPPARLIVSKESRQEELIIWNHIQLCKDAPSKEEWNTCDYRSKQSSVKLDGFHRKLLNSDDDDKMLHGIVSVQYWGNYADRGGDFTGFALSRAKWLVSGKGKKSDDKFKPPQHQEDILKWFKQARSRLSQERLAEALSYAGEHCCPR